jgi:hypothetical protein
MESEIYLDNAGLTRCLESLAALEQIKHALSSAGGAVSLPMARIVNLTIEHFSEKTGKNVTPQISLENYYSLAKRNESISLALESISKKIIEIIKKVFAYIKRIIQKISDFFFSRGKQIEKQAELAASLLEKK